MSWQQIREDLFGHGALKGMGCFFAFFCVTVLVVVAINALFFIA